VTDLINPNFGVAPEVQAALNRIATLNASGDLTVAQLRNIANTLSAGSPPGSKGAILYSGSGLTVTETRGLNAGSTKAYSAAQLAEVVLNQSNDLAIIDNTHVGQFLRSGSFEQIALDFQSRGLISSVGGLWDQAGKRFTAGISGDVIFIGPNASIGDIAGRAELPDALQQTSIRSINGLSRAGLQALDYSTAFELLASESRVQLAGGGVGAYAQFAGDNASNQKLVVSSEFFKANGISSGFTSSAPPGAFERYPTSSTTAGLTSGDVNRIGGALPADYLKGRSLVHSIGG
jgi:hypothetical protein